MQVIVTNFKNSAVIIAVPDFFVYFCQIMNKNSVFYEYARSTVAKEKIWHCR